MSLGGLPVFEFDQFGFLPGCEGVYGSVIFRFEDMLDDVEVAHSVIVKARIKAASSLSIADMREALFRKAVEQLSRALQVAEGKTSQQLSSEAEEKAEAERWKPE
jgi:hypothetical protein